MRNVLALLVAWRARLLGLLDQTLLARLDLLKQLRLGAGCGLRQPRELRG